MISQIYESSVQRTLISERYWLQKIYESSASSSEIYWFQKLVTLYRTKLSKKNWTKVNEVYILSGASGNFMNYVKSQTVLGFTPALS